MCCQGSARIALGRNVPVILLPASLCAKALVREADSCHPDAARRCRTVTVEVIVTSFLLCSVSSRRSSSQYPILHTSSASPFSVCTRNSPMSTSGSVLLPLLYSLAINLTLCTYDICYHDVSGLPGMAVQPGSL